jgi:putative NADH-flavin reductase
VQEALAQGHDVTAVARRPDRLELEHPRLRLVACDVTSDPKTLGTAVAGQEIVISTLGRGLSLRSTHLIERTMATLVPVLERQGPQRIVVMSAFGVGATLRLAPPFLRLVFRTLLSNLYKDKAAGEAILRSSRLDWTVVYAALLINGSPTGHYEISDSPAPGGLRKIRRAVVAAALLVTALNPSTIHQSLIVGS